MFLLQQNMKLNLKKLFLNGLAFADEKLVELNLLADKLDGNESDA